MDYMLVCRMYFGDFVRWVMDNNVNNGCAMGVNPYSNDWDRIALSLQAKGERNVFGDYSGYDGSLKPALQYAVLKVIEDYYTGSTPEERMIRSTLFEDVVNSRHIKSGPYSHTYEWFGSNPSGNFLTTVLNSIANNILIRYTMTIAVERSFGNFGSFSENHRETLNFINSNIYSITFGDDNGISFTDQLDVDLQLWQNVMSEHGFTYTNEDKNGDMLRFKKLSECSFLKRGFKKDYATMKYLAPLSLETIIDMCNWTKKSAPPGSVEQTVDTFFMELSLHDDEEWESYAPTMREACIRKLNYVVNPSKKYHFLKALHCEGYY